MGENMLMHVDQIEKHRQGLALSSEEERARSRCMTYKTFTGTEE
jgi:hypothetical protein